MSQLSRLQNVEETSYPAPPWNMKGQLWLGLFKTDMPVQLPAGLKRVLDSCSLLVILVRYLEGTLRYDELAFGTLARLGTRLGLYVDYIWVTDLASVWGGRHIWKLPKNLAEFSWQDSIVRVTDGCGPIATVQVDRSPANWPWVWVPTPGIGQIDNRAWVFTVGSLWGRLGGAGMQIDDWSARFGYRPHHRPAFSVAAKPFRLHIPAAKVISR